MLGQKKDKVEFVDVKIEKEEIKSFSFKGVIDGSLLTGTIFAKHSRYIIFLVFLAVVYISNRLNAEKVVRNLVATREDVKNLRAEQITTTSVLMNLSKPSTLEDLIEERGLGLKQPTEPPYKIIVND
jgi:hypothetical protein